MAAKPTIGIAVPTYSRPELLTQLIKSIPGSIDVFVSDNAHSMKGNDLRFGPNVTVSASETLIPMFTNWNRALSLVAGNITHVLIPSDDDLYIPGAFDHAFKAITDHRNADIFVFGCDLVDEFNHIRRGYRPSRYEFLDVGHGFRKFLRGVDTRMPGVLFRKAFLDRIGMFDERFQLTAADSELVQRALLLGRSAFVPQTIGLYRVWGGSLTHSRQATAQWMNEIEMWTDKIIHLLRVEHQTGDRAINLQKYKDEIFARNLLAGVRGLMTRRNYSAARDFLRQNRYPQAASFRTKIGLAHCYFRLRRSPPA